MFTSVKSLCTLIDKRVHMIEDNKKSISSREDIERTNENILNKINSAFILLSEESNNKILLEKYKNKIEKIKI